MSGAERSEWRPAANPWLIALTVTLVAFMEILDTTIVNVALPHIAGSLSASNDDATWTLTSYLVANGIVLPLSGFFSRVLGRKRFFLICIAMFTVCSLLCGVSQNLGELIVARFAQGFFGGGLQPNQQSIILDTFPPKRRSAAFAVTAIATVVAPALGPTLGGWLTDSYSWRWVFLINVPFGLLTFIGVTALVQDPPWAKKGLGGIRPDWLGLSLIVIGFTCLQIVLDRGEDDDWFGSTFIIAFAITAAVCLASAAVWLWNAEHPVVNLRVLRDRNFIAGSLCISVLGWMLYSSGVIVAQFVQQVSGYTALLAGEVLSPSALVVIVMIPFVTRIMPLVQTRLLIALGFLIMAGSMLYSGYLTSTIDFYTLSITRITQMVGLPFLFVPISSIAYSTLPKNQNSDATSLFTMFRNVSGSIGVSVSTAVISRRTQVHYAYLGRRLGPLDGAYTHTLAQIESGLRGLGYAPAALQSVAQGRLMRTLIEQASLLAYQDVYQVSAVLAFAVVPICLLYKAGKSGGGGPAH